MKTDKPLLAILFSITAGPIIEGYTMLMKYFGFTNITTLEALSFILQRKPHLALGIIGFITILIGVFLLIYYSANFWGTAFFPLKGMLLVMTIESLFFNIFGVLGRNVILTQSVSGNYVHASAAAISGLWVGFLYQKYLFKNWMGTSLKTDKPLLAIIIGWIGWPVAEIFTQLAKYFDLTTLTAMETSSLVWLTKPSLVLGILSELGLGTWFGLLIYYSTNLWGRDYLPIKSALILLFCRTLIIQIFGVLGRNPLLIQNVTGTFIHALGAVLSGLVIGYFMKRLLFKSEMRIEGGEG